MVTCATDRICWKDISNAENAELFRRDQEVFYEDLDVNHITIHMTNKLHNFWEVSLATSH